MAGDKISGELLNFHLYNTASRKKEPFEPLKQGEIGIYACGPTVYDRIHVGNARPLVVFDVLVRLLREIYKDWDVTYVRNITDVDDKINARAAELGIGIDALCAQTIAQYEIDTEALHVLPPDIEPRATRHIPQMITMIETLIGKNYAYEAAGHVLFDVSKMKEYGALSGQSVADMLDGARVVVASYKTDAADFILWKPSSADQPGWDSPWGRGRPGWHIECSAMSAEYLGAEFDIHAGGLDLLFPHHENELAQSRCAHGTEIMAKYWLHNGYVTVGGKKMSKSTGNFTTVADALAIHRGEAVRYALMVGHYSAPLDYSDAAVSQAKSALDSLYRAANDAEPSEIDPCVLHALADDIDTPMALSHLHGLASKANKGDKDAAGILRASAQIMGLLGQPMQAWFQDAVGANALSDTDITAKIQERVEARANRDFALADDLRKYLDDNGIELQDGPDGTKWQRR